MTGRDRLRELLDAVLDEAHRSLDAMAGGAPLMLVHLDIDHFASVNENMSVAVGDLALDLLARRLEAWLRGRGHLWRHGSDEFVAAIPLPAGGPDASDLARDAGCFGLAALEHIHDGPFDLGCRHTGGHSSRRFGVSPQVWLRDIISIADPLLCGVCGNHRMTGFVK